MSSAAKNIVAGVLAVAAILGVAALFVNVTRSRGSREGEVEEEKEERAIWGISLGDREWPHQVESNEDNIEELVEKGLLKGLGSREGEVENVEERSIWGRSLEEREWPQVESNEGLVEKGLEKGLEAGDRISPNEIHRHERKRWVRHEIEPPNERRTPQS